MQAIGYLVGSPMFAETFLSIPQKEFKVLSLNELASLPLTSSSNIILVECLDRETLEVLTQKEDHSGTSVFTYSSENYYQALSLGFHTLFCAEGWEAHRESLLGLCIDSSNNRKLQTVRDHSETLSIRELLHDLNNALAIMIGKARLINVSAMQETDRELVSQLLEAGRHASSVCRQFTQHNSKASETQAITDIVYSTQRTGNMIQYGMKSDVSVVLDLPKEEMLIPISSAAFTRILLNLIINARDAMPSGGELRLSIQRSWHPQRNFVSTAMLQVSDTGQGIPSVLQSHIFEPFYTTKGSKGTGLGLSAVRSLLNRCGASIQLLSNPIQGTTFEIHFPLVSQPELIRVVNIDSARSEVSKIEPELRTAGFEVLTVSDWSSANAVLEVDTAVQAMILNVESINTDPHLKKSLLTLKPELKILLTGTVQNKENIYGLPLLVHPYTSEQLVNKLKQIMV